MSITCNQLIAFLNLLFIQMINPHKYSSPHLISPRLSLLGPIQNKLPPTDDVYNQLIDIHNFEFLTNPQVCNNLTSLLLIVLISSRWSYYHRRVAIRELWKNPYNWTQVLFLVGEPDLETMSFHDVKRESKIYGDIIMGTFTDTYHNLTYKHIMGLKWVAHHCPIAKYILKVDDDVLVYPGMLRKFLVQRLSPWGARDLMACQISGYLGVPRDKDIKHYVSWDDYPHKYYPKFCVGWVILYSQDAVQSLLKTAQSLPYFWVDDVHVTGVCAKKIHLRGIPIINLVWTWNQFFNKRNKKRNSARWVVTHDNLLIFQLIHDTKSPEIDIRNTINAVYNNPTR